MHHSTSGEPPHLIRLDRNIPGWMGDQMWLQNTSRGLLLGAGVFGAVIVAGAGPERMFPPGMSAATLGTWPWLALWVLAAALVTWHVIAAAALRGMRAASRELRFESLTRAMSFAEDMLLLSRSHCEPVWSDQAVMPLTALVYAASTNGNGQGMPWVRNMVDHLCTDGADGWRAAADAVGEIDHQMSARIVRLAELHGRQRDSIALVLREAVGEVAGARA
ncbi:hypothetical protein [Mycolicibacterium sphagni]|uniref:Uncharacterized protein n=1 Tax=Mycolicibacterium sphagni TaxID=1786 RepID=A0ABX2JXW4_9MYCO|nr:hypothetical protein [Mycolicibacterium sphagni]NTY62588.1 hypothetical protein [Mycolicibacterium sphagni]